MRINEILVARRESIILAVMLEFLHGAIWLDFAGPGSRSFMLMHLGAFLIWQPVWRGDQKLAWYNGVLFIVLALAFVTWLNPWLLFGWLIVLVGFCGGRVGVNHEERRTYLLVLVFLIAQLLIPCTSMLFRIDIPRNIWELFGVALLVLPLIIALMPLRSDDQSLRSVDFLQAIAAATLITLLIVGTLLNMYRSQAEYLYALIQTLLAIGVFLFAISWLLTPRLGFSGLSQLWLRVIMNIGTPFEHWLSELSNLSDQREAPADFLEAAMEELVGLPWISGVQWSAEGIEGSAGETNRYESDFLVEPLTVRLYSREPVGGALYMHCKLLVQLVTHFYVAKVKERELTRQTHLRAIHETGARVTHDIKNLLQSLQAITSIVATEQSESESVSQKLLRRQLPHLTQRLQLALDKLQTPSAEKREEVFLKDWWQDLQRRNDLGILAFQSDISGDPVIPAELFDSVIENLLENLRSKLRLEPTLRITATLVSDGVHIELTLCDDGSRIPEETVRDLFNEPTQSENGLGIGLFQAARHAETLGYSFTLAHNQDGRVCFRLSSREPAPDYTRSPVSVTS